MNSRSQFIIGDQIDKQQECTISNQQAKQIATVKWLLQKAYDNNVPEHLKEPFYYDKRQHQPQQQNVTMNCNIHLKPNIVYSLANAELYCLALANIYFDPNFHNLNHTGIIQALARKNVMLSDPHLTETVLLQTSPLKLTAHLCVIEAIMMLYAKEIATPNRIFAAIKKFNIPLQRLHNDLNSNSVIQQQWNVGDYDQLLLLWISEAVSALNKRIKQQLQSQDNDIDVPDSQKNTSEFFKSPGRELTELCDGVALCALVSFYSPQSLPWTKIRVGKPINTAECIHNLNLFSHFCQFCLPYQIFHMMPQDILPHSISGMRINLLTLLADLFNLFEIHPVNGGSSAASVNSSEFSAASDKGEQDSRTSNSSPKADRKLRNNSVSDSQNNTEFFVVHKGRNIPTLNSVNSEANQREKLYEPVAAGKPSNWNDTRKNQLTGCGRRSRRNSFSDESQLTIENFGGSHENINLLGRNPDKEPAVHVVNSTSDDTTDNNEGGRQFRCQAAAQENWSSAAITSLLRDDSADKLSASKTYNNTAIDCSNTVNSVPAASTAPSVETAEMLESCKVSSQMLNIRLKLEEKRKQIEMEKRRLELNLKKQRQKLNKAAFLQAVSKDINQVEQRWLKNNSSVDIIEESSTKLDGQSMDFENIDIEKCQKSISEMDSSLHAIQSDLQWLSLKENEMLQNPVPIAYNIDQTKSFPVSFSLNQDSQNRNQLLQKNVVLNDHQNQNNDCCLNQTDNNLEESRGIFNKNISDFSYTDGCSTCAQHNHHHSLLSAVSMKSPLSSPHPPMMTAFDNVNSANDSCYMYQMQQQPLFVHTHMSPNFKYNYHSMNLVDNDGRNLKSPINLISDDKENQIHQTRHEQFYLHKPCENPPFQIRPSSATSPIVNLSSITNTSFGQRKSWESSENLSNMSSHPTPPPRMFTSRYSSNNDASSFSKTSVDNTLKAGAEISKFSEEQFNPALCNEDESSQGLTSSKKKYVSSQDDRYKFVRNKHFKVSETDSAHCRSAVGGMSIPTPSADDMEPQCISFIGCQSNDETKTENNDSKTQLNENMNKLNIINGNRTYRIPSPTNKPHTRPSGHYPFMGDDGNKSEKGFYVPFSRDDDENEKDNSRFSERNALKAPFRLKRFNNGNSVSSARIDKLKNNSIKKPEWNKKPEIMYNEKNLSNENQFTQRFQENINSASDNKIIENHSDDTVVIKSKKNGSVSNSSVGLVIASDGNSNDPALVDEMERKKERILLQSLQRRQQQEELKARKEIELQRRKEQEKQKEEIKAKKKEEEKRRRAMILEQHRLKKTIEELEREGKPIDKELLNALTMNNASKLNAVNGENSSNNIPLPKLRSKKLPFGNRPRPKTIHIDMGSNLKENNCSSNLLTSNFSKKGSSVNLTEHNTNYGMNRRDYYRGSQDCLLAGTEAANTAGTSASSIYSDLTDEDRAVSATYPINGSMCGSIGRRRGSSYKTSRDVSLDRATSRIARPKFSSYYQSYPRKSSSLMNLCGSSCDQDSFTYNSKYMTDTDSGLGRATPPHRTSSPAPNNNSPSGPGSLPPSHHSRRLRFDDTASESGGSEYSGLRLYKQPAVKSNRGIIMNAVEYCVFPGEVNRNAKNRILEEINRADATNSKHFLILFRDARCQFRALYSYFPENEEVTKVCGTGPKQVTEKMFDKFFKYNSGGKCFTQVHTKHLTVTIDAFTIHNSLWQGKKVNLPNKRDMTLVI